MRNLITLLAIICLLVLSTCKKDKDDSNEPEICSSTWDDAVGDTYDALIDAWNSYVADMSAENCNAYKEAYLDYIDVLEPFLECTSWTAEERQEVQDLIDEAEDEMNSLSCE